MTSDLPPKERGERETGRVEAFSDGVFAIAVTLLVLDLKVPLPADLGRQSLLAALTRQWPTFLAYLTSFATILVMWVNHHKMFSHIHRVDDRFLFLNGLLLLFVTFVPFPTALVADYLRHPESRIAALIYAGTYEALAIAFNLLWNYVCASGRLLSPHASLARVRAMRKQYMTGPLLYAIAFALCFYSVAAGLAFCILLAVYWALTGWFAAREHLAAS
ncbi:MAG TPA: TMEM175 family protein [Thermoanaerobaculia bacterium]